MTFKAFAAPTLTIFLAACSGGTSGGSGGGGGGSAGGGSGGSGGGLSGAGVLTVNVHHSATDPDPTAITHVFSDLDVSNTVQRKTYSAPDAGSAWFAPVKPGTFELNKSQGAMTAEGKFSYAQTATTATFTLHARSVATMDSQNIGSVTGVIAALEVCFKQAGATEVTFTFNCSSATAPAVTGGGIAAVTVGLQQGHDYCQYGTVGTIALAEKKTGSITVGADSTGEGCLSYADNLGLKVETSGGNVTGIAGSGVADAVITIAGSAH